MCGLALVLTVVVVVASTREASIADPRAPAAPAARLNVLAPRPALSVDEHGYIEALWPIHTQVERAAIRLALGAAFYRIKDIDRAELKTRLDQASGAFRDADERIQVLAPPASLLRPHEGYRQALRLFQGSTSEMLKMYDDGNEAHVTLGFPLSQQGSDLIREVGAELFPEEYPPN